MCSDPQAVQQELANAELKLAVSRLLKGSGVPEETQSGAADEAAWLLWVEELEVSTASTVDVGLMNKSGRYARLIVQNRTRLRRNRRRSYQAFSDSI